MSFSLPMSTLATMQISLKVRLPDGALSFEMHPPPPETATSTTQQSGMTSKQLHVLTSYDFSGVTLTLFTSGTEGAPTPIVSIPPELEPSPPSPAPTGDSMPRPLDEMYNLPNFHHHATISPCSIVSSPYCESSSGSETSLVDRANDFLTPFSRDSTNTTPSASPTSPLGELAPPSLDPPTWMPVAAGVIPDLSSGPGAPPKPRGRRHHRFPCTMGCLMFFSRKHDRLRHEVAQHGRLCDWECASCQGFFSSQATFKKHRCKPVAVARRIGDRDRDRERAGEGETK